VVVKLEAMHPVGFQAVNGKLVKKKDWGISQEWEAKNNYGCPFGSEKQKSQDRSQLAQVSIRKKIFTLVQFPDFTSDGHGASVPTLRDKFAESSLEMLKCYHKQKLKVAVTNNLGLHIHLLQNLEHVLAHDMLPDLSAADQSFFVATPAQHYFTSTGLFEHVKGHRDYVRDPRAQHGCEHSHVLTCNKHKVDHELEKKDLPDFVAPDTVRVSDFKGRLSKVPLCDLLLSNNYFKDSFEMSFNNPRVTHQKWTGTRWCRWGATLVNLRHRMCYLIGPQMAKEQNARNTVAKRLIKEANKKNTSAKAIAYVPFHDFTAQRWDMHMVPANPGRFGDFNQKFGIDCTHLCTTWSPFFLEPVWRSMIDEMARGDALQIAQTHTRARAHTHGGP
jgi:hypothetical protein